MIPRNWHRIRKIKRYLMRFIDFGAEQTMHWRYRPDLQSHGQHCRQNTIKPLPGRAEAGFSLNNQKNSPRRGSDAMAPEGFMQYLAAEHRTWLYTMSFHKEDTAANEEVLDVSRRHPKANFRVVFNPRVYMADYLQKKNSSWMHWSATTCL